MRIGFWAQHEGDDSGLPWPTPGEWEPADKAAVLELLAHPDSSVNFRGLSTCRLCGKLNGSAQDRVEHLTYPRGLIHYIEDHDVMLPFAELLAVGEAMSLKALAQYRRDHPDG